MLLYVSMKIDTAIQVQVDGSTMWCQWQRNLSKLPLDAAGAHFSWALDSSGAQIELGLHWVSKSIGPSGWHGPGAFWIVGLGPVKVNSPLDFDFFLLFFPVFTLAHSHVFSSFSISGASFSLSFSRVLVQGCRSAGGRERGAATGLRSRCSCGGLRMAEAAAREARRREWDCGN